MTCDLLSGRTAHPLMTPGTRLKLAPDAQWTLLGAVFDGDSSGAARVGAAVRSQKLDRDGTDFRVRDSPFVIRRPPTASAAMAAG